MKALRHKHSGYTFVEVMIAGFLFSSLVGLVGGFVYFFLRNYSFSFEEQQVVSQSQGALTRMIREIRNARLSEEGSWPLLVTNDNEFMFYADVTGDLRTDRVRYFVQNTSLMRGVIEPTAFPVSYPIQNEVISAVVDAIDTSSGTIFQYYNGDWPGDTVNNPLAPSQRLSQTRYVNVRLTLNPTQNFGPEPLVLSSGVSIRSLKTNL